MNNIGWIYLDKADYENAMTYFQQALDLRQKFGSPSDVADTTYNLGEAFFRTGQYNQGMDYYLKALDCGARRETSAVRPSHPSGWDACSNTRDAMGRQ